MSSESEHNMTAVMDAPNGASHIKELLDKAIAAGASDFHVNVGMPPVMRVNTQLVTMDTEVVTDEKARDVLFAIIGPEKFEFFEKNRDYDFSMTGNNNSRFRVNAHYQKGSIAMSFRVVSNKIPILEDLHLPRIISDLTTMGRGLVLVTGHTGSGKSTTLAAMINAINNRVSKRIITLEDPVEYLFENNLSMIEQREMEADCTSFASGLRHALRQDPDVILVGEMRDLETTSATITAAETGHLVLSTLHTINASQTIERIIDIYPPGQQNQIRAMLANTLQAIISQTLFKRIDKPGMVPAIEILLCSYAVRSCIRENRIHELPNIITISRNIGMQEMDTSIAELYFKGYIDKDDAIEGCAVPQRMKKLLTPEGKQEFLRNQKLAAKA
ncbi:MAG: PilT/PilU family type 4a pilus ATPase [Sedimentisphaerales bacterium]|nr:PilT/PilU family type 4a pilus ATPase [Sedimentisphaerales bacterium]